MSTDVEMINLKFTLVGPMAGRTVKLAKGRYHFVNGVMDLEVREDHADKYKGLIRQLARSYNAHPAGSKALERAQAAWAENPASKGIQNVKAGKTVTTGKVVKDKGSDGVKTGSEGYDAEGGDESDTGEGNDGESTALTLEQALDALDPDNDAHWTKTGLPDLNTLKEMTGAAVTRAQINEVVEDFTREVAASN